jgi:hypothetical protein
MAFVAGIQPNGTLAQNAISRSAVNPTNFNQATKRLFSVLIG